jgi:DNA-binding winged helix-turn-helix (wHTH) protein
MDMDGDGVASGRRIKFGEFELDPANYVLTRNGLTLKLAPQPFRVLLTLIARPNTLVTRDALRTAVWGNDTVVDFEHGLNTCIRQIRLALDDDFEHPDSSKRFRGSAIDSSSRRRP